MAGLNSSQFREGRNASSQLASRFNEDLVLRLRIVSEILRQSGADEELLQRCVREANGSPARLLDLAEERGLAEPGQTRSLRAAIECSEEAAGLYLQAHLDKRPPALLLKGLEELLRNAESAAHPEQEESGDQPSERPTQSLCRKDLAAASASAATRVPGPPKSSPAEDGGRPQRPAVQGGNLEDPWDDEDPREKTQPIEALSPEDMTPHEAAGVYGKRSPYQKVTRLGHGRLTQTLKARDKSTGELLVLKVFPSAWGRDRAFVDRLFAQAREVVHLRHESLSPIRQVVMTNTECYVVLDYVDGVPLKGLLNANKQFPLRLSLSIIGQLAEAVRALHDYGLRHGSIHPGNIIVDSDGAACLTDVGLGAIEPGDRSELPEGPWLYQALYRAPERHGLSEPATVAGDIYELGLVFYHLLAWHAPYTSQDPDELAEIHATGPLPPLPEALGPVSQLLQPILAKMTAASPENRYNSVEEVLAEIREVADTLHARVPGLHDEESRGGKGLAAGDGRAFVSARRHRFGRSPLPQRQWQTYVPIGVVLVVIALLYAFSDRDPFSAQPKDLAEKAEHLSVHGRLDEDLAAKLAAEGDRALPILRWLIEKGPPEKQLPAVQTLGLIDTPKARALLVEELGHRNTKVKEEALRILGKSKWPQAFEHLVEATTAPDSEVRRVAVMALGEYGDERAVPAIRKRLQDPDISVRRQAERSLEKLGGTVPRDEVAQP